MSILGNLNSTAENNKKELHIGIEHNGILLYEIYTEEFTKEISIGRSSQCDWSLSNIDESASGKHALISLRKGNFYLTDLGSRNGMYFQAKRITEKKLTPGDKISLGVQDQHRHRPAPCDDGRCPQVPDGASGRV